MDDVIGFPPGGPHAPDIEENPRGADAPEAHVGDRLGQGKVKVKSVA
jgi:hypothetical protein